MAIAVAAIGALSRFDPSDPARVVSRLSIDDEVAPAFADLSPATRRAYLADVADIRQWSRAHGIGWAAGALASRHVFAYILTLARSGKTPSTIRRRLTALRHLAGARPDFLPFDPHELALFERRILDSAGGRASVLVVSDDAVIRAGLRGVLTESGAVCWSESVEEFVPDVLSVWDYMLVWIGSPQGADRFGAIARMEQLTSGVTTAVPIVAVHSGDLPGPVRLRLAEAGFRYLVPHGWLSTHLHELSDLLSTASLPIRFHLETPFALRQALGLRLDGSLSELLRAAAHVPQEVWANERGANDAELSRSEVNRLRLIALQSGGLPAPDFAKYSTSMRRAPELPEWPRVRALVRQALGYADTASSATAQHAFVDSDSSISSSTRAG
ncbi:MAG TPA: site-specific integrase [Pseudolysinimonas sp.]|jgi:hypothetical protein